jgi:hypothetical protein
MTPQNYQPNYTLGRGRIFFARYKSGTRIPGAERYIGNTPEFNVTVENEELPHYNSDEGIREKDESISLQTDRSATFTTDHISPENLALFFLGSSTALTVTSASVTDEALGEAEPGLTFQLGMSDITQAGVKGLASVGFSLTDDTKATTYVADTDYIFNAELGRVEILETGNITAGTSLLANYDIPAGTRSRFVSGSQPVEGAMRFISYNPAGSQNDIYMPWVKLTPNGDFALKGDEWQEIPFSVEILKLANREAIIGEGR